MGDFFVECFVKRRTSKKALALQGVLIGLIVTVFAVGLFIYMSKIFFLIGILICFLNYKLTDFLDVEYEYIFTSGDLDFAMIKGKSKRKELLSISMGDVEVVAPKGSGHLKGLLGNSNVKYQSYDFTSGFSKNQDKIYEMLVKAGGQAHHIQFEPDARLLEAMKQTAPRVVFED